ncbi:MAG: hypothetical protein HYS07_09095 [Chlamydiae bacterium]|nr:hypothetical protein [Chlamydiota bacterium]MBI3276966.1 hypothetical protein [Chlamydiota bacterium]
MNNVQIFDEIERREKGLTLIAVVLILLLAAIFGTVLISQIGSGVYSTLNEQVGAQAAYLAEGGQQLSMRYLIDNPNFGESGTSPSSGSFSDTTFGMGSFTVSSFYPLTSISNASSSFMTASSTSVTVNSTSLFPSSGRIQIDLESMTYTGETATSFTGLGRGSDGTTATAHYQRSVVYPATVLSSSVGLSDTTIPVTTTSGFLEAGTLRLQQELMEYSGKTSTSFTGVSRGTHGTTPVPYGAGVLISHGVLQCELTTIGTVGTVGSIGYGARSFRQVVAPILSSNLPGLITTAAGTGTGGFSGDGGQATSARVSNPEGVVVDRQGLFLYIADTGNNRIRRVDLISGIITTVAGTGTAGNTGDGGLATSARLRAPQDVAIDAAGSILYIADTGNNRVRQVNLSTGIISNFAGSSAGTSGNTGDGGSATLALLNSPSGVAIDSTGIVYIVDTVNNRIRRVNSGTLEPVAGSSAGTAGNIPLGAGSSTRSAARFRRPEGVAIGLNDNLIYIADTQTGTPGSDPSKVRVIDFSGDSVTTVAGINSSGFSGDGGAATTAQLTNPQAVEVDFQGNVYIADTGNNRIRKIIPGSLGVVNGGAGENIYTIAGTGATAYNGDNIDPKTATLNSPRGIALDFHFGIGSILGPPILPFDYTQDYFIGDRTHDRVRKVTHVDNLEEVDWRELFQ